MTAASFEVGVGVASDDVRERLVQSALRAFAEKGYAGASLREIAEAAQTTKPMIYYYFKNKEGLYSTTLGDLVAQFAQRVDAATRIEGHPCAKLRDFAEAYLGYVISQEPHVAFLVREVFGLGAGIVGEFGRNLDEHIKSRLRRILDEGVAQGIFRGEDIENSTIAIMGILNMFILRRIFGDHPIEAEAAVAQVIDFYVEGLRRPASRGCA